MEDLKMKIRKKKNVKKIIFILIAIFLVIAGCIGGYVYYKKNTGHKPESSKQTVSDKQSGDSQSTDNSTSTAEEENNETDTAEADSSPTDDDPTNGDKTPPRYESGTIQDSETLTGDISGINLVNGNLSIRVTINQYIDDPDSRCDLTLTDPSGNTHTFWSDLITNPQTSTCYGWDITADDLGGNIANGHWKASVTVTGDNRAGTFTKEVDL